MTVILLFIIFTGKHSFNLMMFSSNCAQNVTGMYKKEHRAPSIGGYLYMWTKRGHWTLYICVQMCIQGKSKV